MRFLFIILLLLYSVPGAADNDNRIITPVTTSEKASYVLHYIGVPIGKVRMWWEENDNYYKMTAFVKTSGIARVFSNQHRTVTLFGRKHGTSYTPLFYESLVEYDDKSGSVSMIYDNAKLTKITVTPVHDYTLTSAQLDGAVDPLTLIMKVILHTTSANHDTPFMQNVYDGKRLNQVSMKPDDPTKECVAPCKVFALRRKPLAGYNEKKMKKWSEDEPSLFMSVYPDFSHFPHGLWVASGYGNLSLVRVKE